MENRPWEQTINRLFDFINDAEKKYQDMSHQDLIVLNEKLKNIITHMDKIHEISKDMTIENISRAAYKDCQKK